VLARTRIEISASVDDLPIYGRDARESKTGLLSPSKRSIGQVSRTRFFYIKNKSSVGEVSAPPEKIKNKNKRFVESGYEAGSA
jgi:hypothetical protein